MECGEGVKWITHYSSNHNILLVGEGDFSFAACLARAFGRATNMVATSLDSQAELDRKHPTAAANLVTLKDMGCTIIHEVDVSNMSEHSRLKHKLFDRIVFNFPHAGFLFREHDDYQIQLHQNVVRSFLLSARKMLRVVGEVHVTHKTAYPFSKWNIKELGEEVGLRFIGEARFYIYEYPGYHNKRGGNDCSRSNDSFPVGECSTFKFEI
ncbi:hypothetical protein RD792_002581 [Penstemon davidsonii]|uniref:25S rRNA (uridine-N(3))-methyltransferase BMT5-like domain-containing protein n=1 Tax=Penstemon davidsonii TaxID=160366 RepID=A0ABR0DRE2_9LAMI|nr:hypothetical protein RD792_002581 [Penstemon davidsonii]